MSRGSDLKKQKVELAAALVAEQQGEERKDNSLAMVLSFPRRGSQASQKAWPSKGKARADEPAAPSHKEHQASPTV